MYKKIDGRSIAKILRNQIKERVSQINLERGIYPKLAVILVGNNESSRIYIKNKKIACNKCGVGVLEYILPENTKQSDLIDLIEKLNADEGVNGILVQLPLPKQINENVIIGSINADKDVDGFHIENIGKLSRGEKCVVSCTPKGCLKLIKSVVGNDLSGKRACVIGRSNIVGKPMAQLLLQENCTVKILHSKSKNLKEEIKWAEIIVCAVGKGNFLKSNMISDNAIVIDVGINRIKDNIVGDVDIDSCKDRNIYITPVPGGVGPMTIACLIENTIEAFEKQLNITK